MARAATTMTFKEFERLPDEPGKCELLEGELIQLPPAIRKHMLIVQTLFLMLLEAVDRIKKQGLGASIGSVHIEMGYRLSKRSWLQPDVSITHPEQPNGKYFERGPLLAVEVVSESNTAKKMNAKVAAYLAAGTLEAWVVYPKTQRTWKYRPNQSAELITNTITSDLLPGFSIDLPDLLNV